MTATTVDFGKVNRLVNLFEPMFQRINYIAQEEYEKGVRDGSIYFRDSCGWSSSDLIDGLAFDIADFVEKKLKERTK